MLAEPTRAGGQVARFVSVRNQPTTITIQQVIANRFRLVASLLNDSLATITDAYRSGKVRW